MYGRDYEDDEQYECVGECQPPCQRCVAQAVAAFQRELTANAGGIAAIIAAAA